MINFPNISTLVSYVLQTGFSGRVAIHPLPFPKPVICYHRVPVQTVAAAPVEATLGCRTVRNVQNGVETTDLSDRGPGP